MIPRSNSGNLNSTVGCAERAGLVPAVAGVSACLTTQNIAGSLFHFLKMLTNGKHLRLENNWSGRVNQLVNSGGALIILILNSYVPKFFFALADTTFLYLGVRQFDQYNKNPENNYKLWFAKEVL